MDYPEKRRVTWIDDGTGDLVGACDYYRHDLLEAANAENERLNETVENCRHDFKIELASRKKAEAERDEARAQVAMVYEVAAQTAKGEGESEFFNPVQAIRALTPAHAQAALEAYGREKVREGMKRAYDLSGQYHQVTHIRAAILAEMEALK